MGDWTPVQLGEVADFLTGFPFKSAEYVDDPDAIRLVRGDNIVQGAIRWDGVKRWPSKLADQFQQYLLFAGDVVLAMDRPWIEAGLKYAAITQEDSPSLLVQRVARLRGTKQLDAGFLRYVIGGRAFTDYVQAVQTGTAIPHISGGQIKAFQFLLPRLAEQRSIASILGALDEKVGLNHRMNETLQAISRAIFKDWFVDFGPTRAKMEARAPYVTPEIWAHFPDRLDDEGKPVEWQIGSLKDVAEITMGISPDGNTYNEQGEGMPLVNGPVEYGDFFLRRIKWTTAPNKVSRRGDLIICVRGSTTGRHAFSDSEYCLGRGVASIRSKDDQQEFIDACVLGHIDRLLQRTTGSVFPSLSSNDFRSFDILVPSSAARKTFCEAVRPIRDRVWANVEQSSTLGNLRDLLLPKLMSGAIRVEDAGKVAEAML